MTFLKKFRQRRKQEKILAEELAAHLEELTAEFVNSGYSPEEARYEARRHFGNQTGLLERSREVWRLKWLDTLVRDLRFTGRLARRQPWTIAAAVASIAIGVGANTAVTSVVDAVLLNPLGIKDSDRIVAATVHIRKLQMTGSETSGMEFRDLQSAKEVFSAAAAIEDRGWTLGGEQPTRLVGYAVTPEFLRVFGERPSVGHIFGGWNAFEVMLSDGLWKSRFGRDPAVIGRKLLLDDRPYEIVGVAPPNFSFPARAEAWVPLILSPDRFLRGKNMVLSLFARLKDGVTLAQAQQRVDHDLLSLQSTPGGVELSKLGYGVDVEPFAQHVAGDLRLPLLLLWSAALVLLVASCANVAGLLLARAGSRRKEIAIRIAVGANRLQILRQLLTESVILALLGGIAGMATAAVSLAILKRQPLPYQHLLTLVRLNERLLFYGLGLAVASSALFGIAPAMELLREQHTGAMPRARRKWFQNIYIVGQVSAAMLLLVVTGLLLKSLKAVESLQPGFDARDITTAFLIKPPTNQSAFYDRLLSELRSSPGVQAAALAFSMPFGGNVFTSLFDISGRLHPSGQPEWQAAAYQVSSSYFVTLHIPLLRGRLIGDTDTRDSPSVCVIDESLAKRFFPNEDPIGHSIRLYNDGARIVGVVGRVHDTTLENISLPAVYYPLTQITYFPQIGVVVRASIPAASIIRDAVAKASPMVPVFDVKTMEERIDASETTRSVMALLVTVFAAISILLAAIGIHGVVAQVVTERTAEIGVRMALGARSSNIFRRYAMQGLQLSIAGIAIGLCLAVACGGWLRGFLYQVQPIDPVTMALGVFGVLAITAMAVAVPSWRASHVDPQIALRSE